MNLDARLTPQLAALAAGVTKQTFNYWRTSGKLTPDAKGEYRLGDVLKVESETRNNPNSRRGITYERRPASGPGSWADISRKPRQHTTVGQVNA